MRLTSQTIAITGGSSGIGLALAKRLSVNNTVIAIGRDERKLAAARQSIPTLHTIACDISEPESRVALSQRLVHQFPALNVLMNNAGIQHQLRFDSREAPLPLQLLEVETNVNFMAPVHLCALLLPHLMMQRQAAILNVTTGLVIVPKTESPLYSASKSALSVFTRTLRSQLRDSCVHVAEAMAPLVDTPMTSGRGSGKMTPDACAVEIIRGVERGRPVIHIGKVKWLHTIHRAWPGLAQRIMERQ